jgi:protoporphyrinogen oxidase
MAAPPWLIAIQTSGNPVEGHNARAMGNNPKIAVVGGGVTGIAAALELAGTGRFDVTLFEKQDRLGGLSGWFQWQDVIWDRFYHVILSTDQVLLEFIRQLGLEEKLFWRRTQSGFYGQGRLVPMSSVLDFIHFPFMNFREKFRLGLGIIYSSRLKDPAKLERIYAREWLTRIFGRRVYENIWEPLLRGKLGEARNRTSAAFMWATINRLYGARSSERKLEKMGHVHGGYRTIIAAAEKRLSESGARVLKNSPIETIVPVDRPAFPLKLNTPDESFQFDKVLLTIDCPNIRRIVQPKGAPQYWERLAKVEYLRIICLVMILRRKLSPYYVINLLDKDLPFTGIIEATNIVDPGEVGGKHIVYLPKYLPSDDPMNNLTDTEVTELFLSGLKKVHPTLDDSDISHAMVLREGFVQPVQKLNFSDTIPGISTPVRNLHVVNSSMIRNSTLNNNAAITLARAAAKMIMEPVSESVAGETA